MPVDLSKLIQRDPGGGYLLDLWNQKPGGFKGYNPNFTNTVNSMLMVSHGKETDTGGYDYSNKTGGFGWQPNRHFSMSEGPFTTNNVPRYTLQDVARSMGPATNNIHNLVLSACESGGCAPYEAFKLFPHLTNVVSTAGGEGYTTTQQELINSMLGASNNLYSTIKSPNPQWKGMPRATFTKGMQRQEPKQIPQFIYTSQPFDFRMLGGGAR